MTLQIVQLYETLYEIASERRQDGVVELEYRESSKELNELHLTFNRVAKTLNLASRSMKAQLNERQQAEALLSYADAYHIYSEFDPKHSQKGVCLANIGSIMMQKGEYQRAIEYFSEASAMLAKQVNDDDAAAAASLIQQTQAQDLGPNKFLLAIRYF